MIASQPDHHLTTLDLDRLVLGDLSAGDRDRVEAHAGRCARCQGRRYDHETRAGHFRNVVLPRTLPLLLARRRPWQARWWGLAIVLPALAVVVLMFTQHPGVRGGGGRAEADLGIMGDGQMQVFVRRAERGRAPPGGVGAGASAAAGAGPGGTVVAGVANGDLLAPGDALRFVLYPSGLPYALIASVDGAGQVNVYFPFHGEASAPVDGALAVPVAASIVLDAAPGPERLYAIFSAQPIRARAVRDLLAPVAAGGAAAIRGTARLPLPGTQQATLLFEKEAAR